MLGPDLELVQTEYDVEAAAEAVRRSGQPRAAEVVDIRLSPPGPEETATRVRGDARCLKWAILDSNQGPPPYQSGALTS